MARYKVTDPISGKTAILTGDSPPTEQELNDIFSGPQSTNTQVPGQLAGTPQIYGADQIMARGLPDFNKDLLTNEKVGFGGNIIRGLPSTAMGAISGMNPAGFAAGEALRQAAVSGNAIAGNTQAPTIGQAVSAPALSAASAYMGNLVAPIIGKALIGGTLAPAESSEMTQIPFTDSDLPYQQKLNPLPNGQIGGVAGAVGRGISNAMQYARENFAGIKSASSKFMQKFPELTSKYLNSGQEVGDQLAQSARDAVNVAVKQKEAEYPALIDAARANPDYEGKTFNLADEVGSKINDIAKKYGFIKTNRIAPAEGAETFKSITEPLTQLKDASLDEVYDLQKTLNSNASASFSSNPALGKAVGEVHDLVRNYLGDNISEIGGANASWHSAKSLQDNMGKLANVNDPYKYLLNTINAAHNTDEKKLLMEAIGQVPGLGDIVQNLRAFQAAQDAKPLLRSMPQNGMGASFFNGFVEKPVAAGVATSYMSGSPIAGAIAGGAVAAKNALTSPRLAFTAMKGAQSVGSSLGQSISRSIFPAATAAGQAATQGILTNYFPQPTTPASMERTIRDLANPNK